MKTYNAVLPAPTLKIGSHPFSFAFGILCDGDEITEIHYLEAQKENGCEPILRVGAGNTA